MTANNVDPSIVDINGGENFLPKKRNKTAGNNTYNPRFAKKKALKNKKTSMNPNKMSDSGLPRNQILINPHEQIKGIP